LGLYKAARHHSDLVLNLNFWNVRARFRRAAVLLQLDNVEAACTDLLTALRFKPDNNEVEGIEQVGGKKQISLL